MTFIKNQMILLGINLLVTFICCAIFLCFSNFSVIDYFGLGNIEKTYAVYPLKSKSSNN